MDSLANRDPWQVVVSLIFLVGGSSSVVYALAARKFRVRSRFWKPGEEPLQFTPRWRDRLIWILGGLIGVGVGLSKLLNGR